MNESTVCEQDLWEIIQMLTCDCNGPLGLMWAW
jgi:hypothetical protein